MRLIHYYPRALGDSGVTLAIWSWARAAARAGRNVAIVHAALDATDEPRNVFVQRTGDEGISLIPVRHWGRGRATLIPSDLGAQLDPGDVLVLHEGWVLSNLIAARAATSKGVPYVVMPHGVYDPRWRHYLRRPRRVRTFAERKLLEGALAVHVFFDAEAAGVSRIAPNARFITAPTGAEPSSHAWTGGGGYLAWIGRYDPHHKGLDLLVDAVRSMSAEDRPVVRLRGYDYRGGIERLRGQVAAARLEPWIQIGGIIGGDEKVEFLRRSEGVLLPSRWESHSLALLEALAMGIPTLISDALPISRLLAHRKGGVVTGLAAPDLAAGLRRLATHGRVLAPAGRRMADVEFSWERVLPAYLAQLDALDAQRRAPQRPR